MIGQLLTWAGGLFAIVVTLILAPLATALFFERTRHFAYWIVDRTADRQPKDIREERRMEWRAHVHGVEGDAWKLVEAMRLALRFMIELPDISAVRNALTKFRDTWFDRSVEGVARVGAVFGVLTILVSAEARGAVAWIEAVLSTDFGGAIFVTSVLGGVGYWVIRSWRSLEAKRNEIVRNDVERDDERDDERKP